MRRLPLLLVAVALVIGAACTDRSTPTPTTSPPNISATPTSSSDPATTVDASTFLTTTPIKHVVFLVKENRTFDNLFGTFPGADGSRVGMDLGVKRPLVRGTDGRVPGDIPHCYACSRLAWNNGAMDGFDQGPQGDWAYTQLHRDQLPNYWHWAKHDALFDGFFASAWGPSFPNHLYSIAAQSGGAHDNPRRSRLLVSNTFGCDAPPQQVRRGVRLRGQHREDGAAVLRLRDRGRPARATRHPVGVLRGAERQKGYIWSAFSAMPRYRDIRSAGRQHIRPVDRVVQRHPQRRACRRSRGSRPRFELIGASRVLASATARTGPRR